jgi:hypothetical protein
MYVHIQFFFCKWNTFPNAIATALRQFIECLYTERRNDISNTIKRTYAMIHFSHKLPSRDLSQSSNISANLFGENIKKT